jgi:hypothetical protein
MKLKILVINGILFFLLVLEGLRLFDKLERFRFTDGMSKISYTDIGYAMHIRLGQEILILKIFFLLTLFLLLFLVFRKKLVMTTKMYFK